MEEINMTLLALIVGGGMGYWLQHRQQLKLQLEIGSLKSKIEQLEKGAETIIAPEALTVAGIMEAVRYAGYVPEESENWVRFLIQGDAFFIDTGRLPRVFLLCEYQVDTNEYEMDIMRHAAHLMSDDLVMVKASITDNPDEKNCASLRFFLAAEDRNCDSFRQNLTDYIGLLEEGKRLLNEHYEKMVNEKRDAAVAANPFMPANKHENKILS